MNWPQRETSPAKRNGSSVLQLLINVSLADHLLHVHVNSRALQVRSDFLDHHKQSDDKGGFHCELYDGFMLLAESLRVCLREA